MACFPRLPLLLVAVCAIASLPLVTAVNNPLTWNYETGVDYLLLSYAAYCPVESVMRWDCKWCQNSTEVSQFEPYAFPADAQYNTFGFVGYSPVWKQIIVSFRGSHNLQNFIIDLELSRTTPYKNYTGVQVHDGFSKAWKNLKPKVMPAVEALINMYPFAPVVVTGHSLGGALATLAAIDIITTYPSQVYVWHYGCPRVGNQAFSQLFSTIIDVHYRHTNNRDIVPHLPPEILGFYHCPTEVWERGSTPYDFKVCDSFNGEDNTCSNSLYVDMSISDHLHYFGYHESCV
eukprot:TRINITY_DN6551_c0_g1_i1.p1 TRINITY_DN6551_c0_g1~~TRINITY_DN6551_c0_g1_i1.p1  ORF type:complete len:289 (+),score=46.04 TRINITY_DN6551_c0_g1_i1:91-957(+)